MKIQSNMYINNPDMTSRNIEKKENSSHALVQEDDIQISDSARKLVETARNKVSDFHTMHFSSINGEIREIPAEYKCENLFKLDLKATSISGEQSAFEGCSENQSEVFEKWLDENASEYLTEDEMKDLKEKINTMTADMDSLNAKEGYRGTSYESVFLLSASEAGLRKVNEMYVPEQFQAGFSDMIDEYVHFNDSARNSIMEKMTPDYMVVGIGSKTESYKYKSEIIKNQKDGNVTTSTVELKTSRPGVTKTEQIKTGYSNVNDYSKYLQGKYHYMNTGTTSMQGVPTTVSVSSAFLQKCMNDPEKAKYLEENLAAIPDCAKSAVNGCLGTLTNLSYMIDANGNISVAISGTNDPDGKIAKENAERKAKEIREKEEKIKEKRAAKKAEEEKAAKKRAEKSAEGKETGDYTLSVTGNDVKSMTQSLVAESVSISAPDRSSFDIKA